MVFKLLAFIPLTFIISLLVGFSMGRITSYNQDTSQSITEEAAETEEEDDFFPGIFAVSMICAVSAFIAQGVVSNSYFRTDGSKYVRTIKNSCDYFLSAIRTARILSVIASAAIGAIVAAMQLILTYDNSISLIGCTLTAIIAASLTNAINIPLLFIKDSTARVILGLAALIAAVVVSSFLYFGLLGTSSESGIIAIAAVAALTIILQVISGIACTKSIKKNWLFS